MERVALTGTAEVPGVPASHLLDDDGPWAPAWPGAADLGAPAAALRARADAGEVTAGRAGRLDRPAGLAGAVGPRPPARAVAD